MPDPKPIIKQTQWKALKKKFGVGDMAVKGVSVGKSLDEYLAKIKPGQQYHRKNGQAAAKLAEVLKTYSNGIKSSKDKKMSQSFLDEVVKLKGNADHNRDLYEGWAKDVENLSKVVQQFGLAVHALPKNGTTLDQLRDFRSKGKAQAFLKFMEQDHPGVDSAKVVKFYGDIRKGMISGLEMLLNKRDVEQRYIDTWVGALHDIVDKLIDATVAK